MNSRQRPSASDRVRNIAWSPIDAQRHRAAAVGIPWWTLAGRAQLVATSHERDLDLALAEVRRDQIRQIEEERSRREPRKSRMSRYLTRPGIRRRPESRPGVVLLTVVTMANS